MSSTKITLLISALLLCLFLSSAMAGEEVPGEPATTDTGVIDTVEQVGQTDIGNEESESFYPLSPERKELLISYSRFVNIWRFVEFFLSIGILALILFTGFSARLRDWASAAKRKFFVIWLFLILFLLADYILNLPFHVYRGFIVESQYGFMNQSFGSWLGEDLLALAISMVFMVIPVYGLYWLINNTKRWWLWMTVISIPFAILTIVVVPVVISPMFNDFEPLKDKQLESEILGLASKAGIEGSDVFQVNASKQSTKINAYVTGLFNTKRIVLYDTMIDNFETDEIKFVMGHEMGHYVMNHIWQGLGVAILFIGLALWISSRTIQPVIRRFSGRFKFNRLGDIASLPLVLIYLLILSFLFEPIVNGVSRHMERQSDKYGMDISGVSGESAAIAFDKLSALNLSDPDPHPIIEFWFYSHPALNKRINFVKNYQPEGLP